MLFSVVVVVVVVVIVFVFVVVVCLFYQKWNGEYETECIQRNIMTCITAGYY